MVGRKAILFQQLDSYLLDYIVIEGAKSHTQKNYAFDQLLFKKQQHDNRYEAMYKLLSFLLNSIHSLYIHVYMCMLIATFVSLLSNFVQKHVNNSVFI